MQQDHVLIDSAQRGDRLAFAQIIERHQGAIYGYLRSRLFEPADAEDMCQEVFLRSYTARARFDSGEMVRPWLIGIARNLLREHARRTRRRREVAWTELCLDLESLVVAETWTEEDVLAQLPGCLDALGQSAREAIDLHYQNNLRLSEIAARQRRSEGAVKLLLFRARQALKNCLRSKLTPEK